MLPESRVKEPYADIQDYDYMFIPAQGMLEDPPHGLKFGKYGKVRPADKYYTFRKLAGAVEIRRRRELTKLGYGPYVPAIDRQFGRAQSYIQRLELESQLASTRKAYIAYYAKFGIKVQEIPVVAK